MLSAVVIRESPNSANRITLPIGPGTVADSQGYQGLMLKDAQGLTPVDAEIHSYPLPGLRGSFFEGASLGARNVVLRVGYDIHGNNGGTVQDIRRRLYQLIRPGETVRVGLEFGDTAQNLFFTAYVESVEPVLFSEDPEIQISLLSMDAYMEGSVVRNFNGIFNDGGSANDLIFANEGDAPAGGIIQLTALESATSVSIRDRFAGTQFFTMNNLDISVNERIRINTIPGQRVVEHRSSTGGLISRPFTSISAASTWPMFAPGNNRWGLLTSNPRMSYEVEYRELFMGV